MKRRRYGYILVETITAMAILSITAVTVQRAIQVSIHARGLAQDYTTAQFLLENTVAEQTLQPRIAIGAGASGVFPPPHERFHYAWKMTRVDIPLPAMPPGLPPEQIAAAEQAFLNYMGKLRVEISWSRGGQPVTIVGETLLSPDQAWRNPLEVAP